MKKVTYHYHETAGINEHGVNDCDTSDPGWKTVEAESYDAAFRLLPLELRERIIDNLASYMKEQGRLLSFEDFLGETCGWGLDYSFVNPDEWTIMIVDDSQ